MISEESRVPRVLMILNNAPDYREPFLRDLARSVDLTVVARPCEDDSLSAPDERLGYRYFGISARRFAGFLRQPGLGNLIDGQSWDIICSSINMRDIGRLWAFFRRPRLHSIWIWWGHIFGRTPLPGLEWLRSVALRRSAGVLAFNEGIAEKVRERYGILSRSFNNTQVRSSEFRNGVFRDGSKVETLCDGEQDGGRRILKLLFVGRYQPRKMIERLLDLLFRRDDVVVRLVGPGMESLARAADLERTGRLERFGRTVGVDLEEHFDWADIVANPGHAGLLVMNAASHGKGIVVDSGSDHAPEYWLAREADQPFIDFGDAVAVDRFIDECLSDEGMDRLRQWGAHLQNVARERYTIEHMARVHVEVFEEVLGS